MPQITQNAADIIASRRARERHTITVETHISEFVSVEVRLADIPTEKLAAEMRDRVLNDGHISAAGELADGHALYSLDTGELQHIRHLFLIGREAEAADRCRRMIVDMLGTAL